MTFRIVEAVLPSFEVHVGCRSAPAAILEEISGMVIGDA
jgi:hypothetical protein